MRRLICAVVGAVVACGQGLQAPFTLDWLQAKCIGCKITRNLGRIQFTGRNQAWAIGYDLPSLAQGTGDYVVCRSADAGRTWKELIQTQQHSAPPTFSFTDRLSGWIALWNATGNPGLIRSSDGGVHWQDVSGEFIQKLQFFDETHGYATEGTTFLRTSDGGKSWNKTRIAHLRLIDSLFFLSPDVGWIAGAEDNHFLVLRTVDGGHSWEESRNTTPENLSDVRDLFFLDPMRGWVITWHNNNNGSYLFATVDGGKTWAREADASFQGKYKWAGVVRFVSASKGFVFESENPVSDRAQTGAAFSLRHSLIYTSDGGAHWRKQSLSYPVHDCQALEGVLRCSAGGNPSGFGVLSLSPK